MGVCSKESKGQMCFSAGFTFQGVTSCNVFCRLSLLFEATILCFSPDVDNAWEHSPISVTSFAVVCSDTPFLLFLAGIFLN